MEDIINRNRGKNFSITIAIPCYNEENTIAKVIDDFYRELPNAKIVVFDNNSTDKTVEVAKKHGAKIIFEKRQGKGYVVQNMFKRIKTDLLVMVDGDDTYFADDVHKLISLIKEKKADMVVGNRFFKKGGGFTYAHRFGNSIFRLLLNYFFRTSYKDILSGYRVVSKNFYSKVPLLARGFEVETELTLQALEGGYSIDEVLIKYKNRPEGSQSKISSFKDGIRIIGTIISLFRDYRPMVFFSYLSGIFVIGGIFLSSIIINKYYNTAYINKIPTAVLFIAFVIIGVNIFISGLILSAVNRRHRESESIIIK